MGLVSEHRKRIRQFERKAKLKAKRAKRELRRLKSLNDKPG